MHKTYQINEGQSVTLNSANGWLLLYREYFGKDILPDLLPALEAVLNIISNTAGALEGTDEAAIIKAITSDEVINELFIDLSAVEVTTALNVFWAMAKNEDKSIPEPVEFFNQFETFPVDQIAPKVFGQIIASCISSKNLESLEARIPFIRTMLSSEE